MRVKFFVFTIGLLLLSTLSSGCWDLLEVDKRAFVSTIGIDGNKEGMIHLSAQIPLPHKMLPPGATTGGESGKQFSMINFSANSVNAALNGLQAKTYQEVVIEQTKSVVINEELARQGITAIVENFIRNSQMPPQAILFFTANHTAKEILSFSPAQEILPGLQFIQAAQLVIKSDWTYYVPLWEFGQKLVHKATDPFASLISLDQKNKMFVTAGLAVFNGDRLTGKLDMAETQYFGLLAGLMQAGGIKIDLPDHNILTLRNVRGDSKINVSKSADGAPFFLVKTEITGTLNEITDTGKELTPTYIRKLESDAEQVLQPRLVNVIKKLQGFNSDIVGFGDKLRIQHQDMWQRTEWKDLYPTVPFAVEVKLKIVRDGTLR